MRALQLLILLLPVAAAAQTRTAEQELADGRACLERQQHQAALAHFAAAVRLAPRSWKGYYYRGHARAGLGRRAGALRDFSRSIALEPNVPRCYVARARLLIEIAELKTARDDLDLALELRPTLSEAYYYRGIAWAAERKLELAVADYTMALKLQPRASMAHYRRGLAYLDLGRIDQAAAESPPLARDRAEIARLLDQQVRLHRAARLAGVDLGRLHATFEGTRLAWGWAPGARTKLTRESVARELSGLPGKQVEQGTDGLVVGSSRHYTRGAGTLRVVALIFRDAAAAGRYLPLHRAWLALREERHKQNPKLKHEGALQPAGPLDLGAGKEGWHAATALRVDARTSLVERTILFQRGPWLVVAERTATEQAKQFDLVELARALAGELKRQVDKQ